MSCRTFLSVVIVEKTVFHIIVNVKMCLYFVSLITSIKGTPTKAVFVYMNGNKSPVPGCNQSLCML